MFQFVWILSDASFDIAAGKDVILGELYMFLTRWEMKFTLLTEVYEYNLLNRWSQMIIPEMSTKGMKEPWADSWLVYFKRFMS
uniref:Uncharacterized protein n=1 Tax=Heterorhabditis bacteriophora TaxID=37862 RepID=A0A1I7WKA8_HETBA